MCRRGRNRGFPCRRKVLRSAPARALGSGPWEILRRLRSLRACSCNLFKGRRRLYDRPARLSSLRIALRALKICRPEVRPPLPGQALGLAPPVSRDLPMIAGDEHIRNGPPLPDLGLGVLRVFEQALGKTFLAGRGFLP